MELKGGDIFDHMKGDDDKNEVIDADVEMTPLIEGDNASSSTTTTTTGPTSSWTSMLKDNSTTDTTKSTIQKIIVLAKPERMLIILSAITLIITSAIQLLIPYYAGRTIDVALSFQKQQQKSVSSSSSSIASSINGKSSSSSTLLQGISIGTNEEANTTTEDNNNNPHTFNDVVQMLITLFIILTIASILTFCRNIWQSKAGHLFISRIKCQLYESILLYQKGQGKGGNGNNGRTTHDGNDDDNNHNIHKKRNDFINNDYSSSSSSSTTTTTTTTNMSFFDMTTTGDIISRLSTDTIILQETITGTTLSGLRSLCMSIGAGFMLLYTSSSLAMISLTTLPPIVIGAKIVGKKVKIKNNHVQALHGKATSIAEISLNLIKTVLQFNGEKNEISKYTVAINEAHQTAIQTSYIVALFDLFVQILSNGAMLIVLGYGGYLIATSNLTAGELTRFLMYSLLMAGNVSNLSNTYMNIMKSLASANRIFDYYNYNKYCNCNNNNDNGNNNYNNSNISSIFIDILSLLPTTTTTTTNRNNQQQRQHQEEDNGTTNSSSSLALVDTSIPTATTTSTRRRNKNGWFGNIRGRRQLGVGDSSQKRSSTIIPVDTITSSFDDDDDNNDTIINSNDHHLATTTTTTTTLSSLPQQQQKQQQSSSSSSSASVQKVRPLSVEFINISFSYPSRSNVQVLGPNFNLYIKPGEVIAIVGSSGSGKSTITSLLTRLYDIHDNNNNNAHYGKNNNNNNIDNTGTIRIDGKDIYNDMNSHDVRKHVGIVSQEPNIFPSCTIYDNIKYGNPKASDKEIYDAANIALVTDFTNNFPNGLHTVVGTSSNNTQLSGGQKQRICIARSIIKKPSIIVFDEATSALDSKSEHIVQRAIEQSIIGRTTIFISHRLSTIRNVDKIIVLNKGQILEKGTWEQLTTGTASSSSTSTSTTLNHSIKQQTTKSSNCSIDNNNTDDDVIITGAFRQLMERQLN